MALSSHPIDLATHGALCVRFRRDSFAVSFPGGAERFDREQGPDGTKYMAWLAKRVAAFPAGHVHVWDGERLVGQIEAAPRGSRDPVGYVNLFYIVPELRGRGLGAQLDAYVVELFCGMGIRTLQLTVSASNGAAIGFYEKHGWQALGPRDDQPESHLMQKTL